MWNYIPGVSNPAERKQTLTAAEKLQRDCAYDTDKQKRKYHKQWEQDFDWLRYDQHGDEDVGKMFCSICEKFCPMRAARESNSFIQGFTSLRINCIRAHNDSIIHKASVVEKESYNKHVSDNAIGKGFRR